MNRKRLIKLVNEQLPNGILCTTGQEGQPNAAIIGSARMDNPEILRVGLMDNRSLANLRIQPKAVYLCSAPGASPLLWRGARIYLTKREITTQGEAFDTLVMGVRNSAGDAAADRIVAAVSFEITTVRPLIDI